MQFTGRYQLGSFDGKRAYTTAGQLLLECGDDTLVLPTSQSDECLSTSVIIGIIEPGSEGVSEIDCIEFCLRPQPECRPISNVCVRISAEEDQLIDSEPGFTSSEREDHGMSDIGVTMPREASHKRIRPLVPLVGEGDEDRPKDIRIILVQHGSQEFAAFFWERPVWHPELPEDVRREAPFQHTAAAGKPLRPLQDFAAAPPVQSA